MDYMPDPMQIRPRLLAEAERLDQLSVRVRSLLAASRDVRARTAATRKQVHASAEARRSRLPLPWNPVTFGITVDPPMLAQLTRRMRQILQLLVQGMSEKEVAVELGLSPHTIHIHVTRMYARLGVNSRAELLALFYRQSSPQPVA